MYDRELFNFNSTFQLRNPALPRLLKVTSAVYPHLDSFTGKLNVRCLSRHTQLRISKLRVFPWVSRVPRSKSVQGFLSYDKTNKETDRQTEIATLYIDILCLSAGLFVCIQKKTSKRLIKSGPNRRKKFFLSMQKLRDKQLKIIL